MTLLFFGVIPGFFVMLYDCFIPGRMSVQNMVITGVFLCFIPDCLILLQSVFIASLLDFVACVFIT